MKKLNIGLGADASGAINELGKLNNALDQHQKEVAQTQKAYESQRKQTDAVGKSNKRFRASLGQVGHQVQDFTVQLQGGQNALLAFTQQSSQ